MANFLMMKIKLYVSSLLALVAVLQSQDHGFLGLVSTETYQQEVKDSSTFVFFGGDQASCSSNSDRSCHYEYRSTVGVYDQNRNNLSDSYKEFGGYYDKEKGLQGLDGKQLGIFSVELDMVIARHPLRPASEENMTSSIVGYIESLSFVRVVR
ncbi:unnamed protein product [Lactuca saligna]|uniref:Uncharacterized protein n=1 Tax=Lactuca saligna TaxID=75948 RepID=A0AA35VD90_LACSI|nr:unnamed protein product [Lactuca saligna]